MEFAFISLIVAVASATSVKFALARAIFALGHQAHQLVGL